MDVFLFLSVLTIQIAILSIVAILFGHSRLAERAITELVAILSKMLRR